MFRTTVRVIWRYLGKVHVETDTAYGSEDKSVMEWKYLWGALRENRVMDKFLRSHFQNPEVEPHINLYLFKHRPPRVEAVVLR